MSYNVFSIPPFDKQLKRLAKKYPSIKNEFSELIERLELEPEQGTNLGNNCYKIRIAIALKRKRQEWRCKGDYQFCYCPKIRFPSFYL